MKFVDTNIIIRYLVMPEEGNREDERQAEDSKALLQQVERGEETITTSEVVVAEACYVLSSPKRYALSHPDVSTRLRPILSMRGFKLPNKLVVLRALDLYSEYAFLDFEDCLIVATMQHRGITALYSYDEDFDGLPQFQSGNVRRLPQRKETKRPA